MKFFVLAALVAASSAAGLRASANEEQILGAWYNFGDKAECVGKVISSNSDELAKQSNEVLNVLKNHSAFAGIVKDIETIQGTFNQTIQAFEGGRFPSIGEIVVLARGIAVAAGKAVALPVKLQLISIEMTSPETLDVASKAVEPLKEFAVLIGKIASKINKEC